jgi:hypothetical protein
MIERRAARDSHAFGLVKSHKNELSSSLFSARRYFLITRFRPYRVGRRPM